MENGAQFVGYLLNLCSLRCPVIEHDLRPGCIWKEHLFDLAEAKEIGQLAQTGKLFDCSLENIQRRAESAYRR